MRSADSLVKDLMLDVPVSPAAACDYGLNGIEQYRALQIAVKSGKISGDDLHSICGDGKAITNLVAKVNPPSFQPKFVTGFDTNLVG